MRVLMIVQELNEKSWLRGFIVGWVGALAAQVDELHVLTLELGEANLPENVFVQSMGKEKGYSRIQELRQFYRGVGRTIKHVDVIFSHMTPRYTWLAAPYAAMYRKPQMLWFIHPRLNTEIRLAASLARWITTATTDSFPLQSSKVYALGHGIDTDLFSPGDKPASTDVPLILAVGRMTPIKQHHVLLEAAALMHDHPIRFAIAGHTAAPGDEAYQAMLLKRRAELGIAPEKFQLLGGLLPDKLVAWMRQAAVVTNLTPAGSFDKAALEAMLTGTPLVTSNPAFDSLLGEHKNLLRAPEDAAGLATRLTTVLTLSPEQRQQIGLDLRGRTAAVHGLEGLMQRMVALMERK